MFAYARHAQTGRVHFSRISSDISYDQIAPDPADILAKMADAGSVGDALAGYNPPHQAYKLLKAQLAAVRGGKSEPAAIRISSGPALKVGMQDERVPQLRERLGIVAESDSTTYDKTLAEAVKKFQTERKLAPSGQLTAATVDALNGPRRDTVEVVIANMERWRWVPRILGTNHVVVCLPHQEEAAGDEDEVAPGEGGLPLRSCVVFGRSGPTRPRSKTGWIRPTIQAMSRAGQGA